MTLQTWHSPLLAATAAALCVLGLVLLAPQPRAAMHVALRLGLASLVWVGLWTLAMPLVGVLIERRSPDNFGPWGILAINLMPALGSWLPAAILVRATRASRRQRGGFATLCALFWAAGLVLPGIGQGGDWAAQSQGLLACCALLAVMLGLLSRAGRIGVH